MTLPGGLDFPMKCTENLERIRHAFTLRSFLFTRVLPMIYVWEDIRYLRNTVCGLVWPVQ